MDSYKREHVLEILAQAIDLIDQIGELDDGDLLGVLDHFSQGKEELEEILQG